MHLPCIREHADLPCIHTGNNILILCVRRLLIPSISIPVYRLGITEPVHQEDHFLLFHLLLFKDRFLGIFHHGTAFTGKF